MSPAGTFRTSDVRQPVSDQSWTYLGGPVRAARGGTWTALSLHRRRIRAKSVTPVRGSKPGPLAEEILVLVANADAAKELVRNVALEKGAAFGWHRTLRFASVHRSSRRAAGAWEGRGS